MIRKMQNIDIDRVADIWLKTNLKAHYFIPEQYWKHFSEPLLYNRKIYQTSPLDKTIEYYNQNADMFAQGTRLVDFTVVQER